MPWHEVREEDIVRNKTPAPPLQPGRPPQHVRAWREPQTPVEHDTGCLAKGVLNPRQRRLILSSFSTPTAAIMRFSGSFISSLLLLGAGAAQAAASWGFTDATVSVVTRGAGSVKEALSSTSTLDKTISLGAADTLKILATATENGKAKRPHQAFLLLRDEDNGLELAYGFTTKDSGKGKVELTQKDIPTPLLNAKRPLRATIVIASFGTTAGFDSHAFDLAITLDPAKPLPPATTPLRYGKLPEIHHIFKTDPKSPPRILSGVFVMSILASVLVLFGAWQFLDANLSHVSKAMSKAPIAHSLYFGSIVAMEGIFLLYYSSWNLFQTLPVAAAVGLVTFLSGTKALSEVQTRRLAGER